MEIKMQINEFGKTMKAIFETKNIDDMTLHPKVINDFLSFNISTFNVAKRLNPYIYNITPKQYYQCIILMIPRQSSNFISKSKKIDVVHKLFFLFDKIKKYYKWSERELNENADVLNKLYKNKDKLIEDMKFVGCEKKYFKQIGYEHKENKIKGLDAWM